MRLDGKPQPPPYAGPPRNRPGRPPYFGNDQLFDVWLLVEELRARTGWSVNRACQECSLTWVTIGRDKRKKKTKLSHAAQKETLRSLYYKADRILKDEQEAHDEYIRALRRVGARSAREADPLPIRAYLEEQLQLRLALTNS